MQPRLDLRLSQRLIMTPQLQQAIKLLQLSRLELQQALTQQSSKTRRRRQALLKRVRIQARSSGMRRTLQEKPAEMKPAERS